MDKTTIIILITAILVSLVLGAGLGIFYQMQKDATKIQAGEKNAAAIKDLSSDLVLSAVVYGEVSAINGKNITLSYNGKTMQVEIAADATIYSVPTTSGSSQTPITTLPKAKISDIKTGNILNITMKVLPDGSLIGKTVGIISSSK